MWVQLAVFHPRNRYGFIRLAHLWREKKCFKQASFIGPVIMFLKD